MPTTFDKLHLISLGLTREFPDGNSPFQMLARLMEECGELAEQVHIFEDSGVKRKKHGAPDPHKLAAEIRDVLVCMTQIAEHYSVLPQVESAINYRIERLQQNGRLSDKDIAAFVPTDEWPPRNVACAGAVVVDESGRVLLVRQARGTSLAGQWSVPWGIVDRGEYPDAAAVRETLEESGVSAEITAFLGTQNLNWKNATAHIYLCKPVAGAPAPDNIETDAVAWFTLTDLDTLNQPIERWTEWLVRRVLQNQHTQIAGEPYNPFKPQIAFL